MSDEQIAALGQWIDAGAKWLPGELVIEAKSVDPAKLGRLPAGYRPVFALALSPDDRQLAAGHGSLVTVHNLAEKDNPPLAKLTGHRDAVQSIAWSPDGQRLATGGFRKVLLWNTADWSSAGEITDLPGRVTAMTFTVSNAALATASNAPGQAGEIALWNVADLARGLAWQAHDGTVFDLAIAPDGETLASAGADKLVRFWSLAKGEQVMQIEAHTAPVLSLAYKPDGALLASGGADKELKIWDTKTREQKKPRDRPPRQRRRHRLAGKESRVDHRQRRRRPCASATKPAKAPARHGPRPPACSIASPPRPTANCSTAARTTVAFTRGIAPAKSPAPSSRPSRDRGSETKTLPKPEAGRKLRVPLKCGCSSMVERKLPKLDTRVRFPSPAPLFLSFLKPVVC